MRKAAHSARPLLGVCFFINIIDRTNVSIAALEMNADIGLSAALYLASVPGSSSSSPSWLSCRPAWRSTGTAARGAGSSGSC
ncbi:MFS transporter [Pseudonocardia sp. MCCB 268]|nr:MFS transporter [Pseudonocardia cytotoxica]